MWDNQSLSAWFYTNCTVKYSFQDADDAENKRYLDFIKSITENQNATSKQRLAFLNWALTIHFHERKPGKREYLWPSELSGMLVKENGVWKIVTLHFDYEQVLMFDAGRFVWVMVLLGESYLLCKGDWKTAMAAFAEKCKVNNIKMMF